MRSGRAFLSARVELVKGGLIKLPDNVSFDEASLLSRLHAAQGMEEVQLPKRRRCRILGAGPTGLMHVLLALTFGAGKIFVIDINDFRLNFAKKYGVRCSTLFLI